MTEHLQGWKEISTYLGIDVRTAQRWRKERKLPVKNIPGGRRAPVWANRKELDDWRGSENSTGTYQENRVQTPAGEFDRQSLFSYPAGEADAIRLWGRGAAYVSAEHFVVEYNHKPYVIPRELQKDALARIERIKADARALNKIFFNGPCVRLLQWHHNQMGAAEEDTLRLVLGPLGWYDYEGINGLIKERQTQSDAYRNSACT